MYSVRLKQPLHGESAPAPLLHLPAHNQGPARLPSQGRGQGSFGATSMLKDRELDRLVEVTLKIGYDGANWVFLYRSQDVLLLPQFWVFGSLAGH